MTKKLAEGEMRVVLHLHPALAPMKATVLPLSKKENLASVANRYMLNSARI